MLKKALFGLSLALTTISTASAWQLSTAAPNNSSSAIHKTMIKVSGYNTKVILNKGLGMGDASSCYVVLPYNPYSMHVHKFDSHATWGNQLDYIADFTAIDFSCAVERYSLADGRSITIKYDLKKNSQGHYVKAIPSNSSVDLSRKNEKTS